MDRRLNKTIIAALFFCGALLTFSQTEEEKALGYKDYKDQEQFRKFHKRSAIISAWQINALKSGALVVRLKTNKTLIDALLAQGNTELAKEKAAEIFIVNKNTMKAYLDHYNFSSVYFIFSNFTDSLLNGARSGIFLDTNLRVSSAISMKEKYYLIAERDYAYNSSIGFVREDSARFIKETGNPVREMGVVLKNKYGHQLKNPFPYYVKDKNYAGFAVPGVVTPVTLGEEGYTAYNWHPFDKEHVSEQRKKAELGGGGRFSLKIRKEQTYKSISVYVEQFNEKLSEYYRFAGKPPIDRMTDDISPYLY